MQDLLGQDVDAVGDQDREGYLDRGIPQAAPEGQDNEGQDEADDYSAPAYQQKVQAGLPHRKRTAGCHGESHPEDHQPRAVVNQALAADDRSHALGHAEAPEDRLRRHGIGGREDGPEDEGHRPGQADDEVGNGGHPERRNEHEAHGQQHYRPEVGAQVEGRGREGRRVQERRQEEHEDHLRRHLHRGQHRHETQPEPSERPGRSGTGPRPRGPTAPAAPRPRAGR